MTSGDDLRKIGTGQPDEATGPDGSLDPRAALIQVRRRVHASRSAGGPKGHQLDRINRIRIMAFSLGGGLLGFVVGLALALSHPAAPGAAFYPFVAGALGWAVVAAIVSVIVGGAGGLAGTIYMPSGAGTSRREYSLAESLVARGSYEDAVSAYELAVGEHPEDPVPYLRIARICRDHLSDPGAAARWFKRARVEATLDEARRRTVTRELIELYRRAGEPTRAAPELARLAELHPDTQEGRWAREELVEVKKLISDGPG